MSFYVIESFSQLETVYMHLREPIPAICEFVDANEMDIIVVPGVVFDPYGYRIGYGGGYYDRYVLNYNKGKLMSLLFDEQIIDCVPTEAHDCPVDIMVTPQNVLTVLHNEERMKMDKMLDIYELLKTYGTYIYTRDPIGDLMLMEDEIRELYKANVLDIKDYQMALLLIRQETTRLRMEEHKSNV